MKPQTKTLKPMTREEWETLPAIVQYFLRDEMPKGCKVKELAPRTETKNAPDNGATSAPLPSLEARKG